MNEDRRLNERLREAAQDYHAPPPPPRDRMFARIAAARRGAVAVNRRSWWRRTWVAWPAAAAVILLIGVGIGRQTTSHAPESDLVENTVAVPDRTRAFVHAAGPILSRAELLLTRYRTGAETDPASGPYSARARTLLADTRLLLASPASQDPEMKRLLSDLELTLARIIHVADQEIAEERAVVENGITTRGLIPRLRNHSADGTPRTSL